MLWSIGVISSLVPCCYYLSVIIDTPPNPKLGSLSDFYLRSPQRSLLKVKLCLAFEVSGNYCLAFEVYLERFALLELRDVV